MVVANGQGNVGEIWCRKEFGPFPFVVEIMVVPERDDPESVAVLWEAVRQCVDSGMYHLVASLRKFALDVAQCFPLFGSCEG